MSLKGSTVVDTLLKGGGGRESGREWEKGKEMIFTVPVYYYYLGVFISYCHLLASLALYIGLQSPIVCLVYNATTVSRLSHSWRLPSRVMVEYIENSNEELVCVLLLVSS